MTELRQAGRQPTGYRKCSLGLLSFAELEISDHTVRILDMNSRGMAIESDERLEPGLVWFHNSVDDHRGGFLVWCGRQGEGYRAGIRFLSLSPEDERLLRYWPPCPGQLRECNGLEEVVSAWMKAANFPAGSESDMIS